MSTWAPQGYVPALGYRWLTPLYDTVVRYTTREAAFKSALLKQAGIRAGHSVLDLACGTGTLAIEAKRSTSEACITGVDGDPEVLARAQRKASDAGVDLTLDQALSWSLAYRDASFDRVLCSLFFHHLSRLDKQRTLVEVHRVLRPGGELHVADWGKAANPLMRAAFVSIQLLDGFSNTRDNVIGMLPDLIAEAGLVDVTETRRFSTMWGTLSLYRANKPASAP